MGTAKCDELQVKEKNNYYQKWAKELFLNYKAQHTQINIYNSLLLSSAYYLSEISHSRR